MKVVEGIHCIDEVSDNRARSNAYLVIDGAELAVIDTGTPGNSRKITEYIQGLGHHPSEVKAIILTHCHPDHVGSAYELRELTNAKIAVHEGDADVVSGKRPLPEPREGNRPTLPFEPVPVDTILEDGDRIAGLSVHHAPGHTLGSIMLLDEARNVLFAGDTIRYDGERVTAAPEEFSMDMAQVRASIAMASRLRFDVLLPGHGPPLTANASEAVRAILT